MARLLHKKQTQHGYHGMSVYKMWTRIVARCENESSGSYGYYGGRGIRVCDEWRLSPKSFCDWAMSNGYEEGLTIDRIDNDGDYEPANCQFVTHKENCAPGKRRIRKDNRTGHAGISISKSGRFEVFVTFNGKQKYIGVRKTIKEAVLLRDEITGNIHNQ